MRTIRGLVAALLVGLGVMAFAPTPAYACSCVGGDAADYLAWSDVVVTGTVEERDEADFWDRFDEIPTVTYTIGVDRVYAGDPGRTVEVLTPEAGATCGLDVELGRRYVVFASHEAILGEPSDDLWMTMCGGTAPASQELVGEVEGIVGEGSPPRPATPVAEPLAAPAALASGGVLVVLTGVMWLRLWRR